MTNDDLLPEIYKIKLGIPPTEPEPLPGSGSWGKWPANWEIGLPGMNDLACAMGRSVAEKLDRDFLALVNPKEDSHET